MDAQMKLIFSIGGLNFYYANNSFADPGICTWDDHVKKNVKLWPPDSLTEANARIVELEKQIEKAEKVVEFYGAKENWRDEADSGVKVFGPFKDHKTWTDCGYEYDWENLHDQGEKAREYFADKEKK